MYEKLKQKGVGNFSDEVYMCVGEDDVNLIEAVDFSDRTVGLEHKDNPLRVRPVRFIRTASLGE